MLEDFQLTALVRKDEHWALYRIPLHQGLQTALAKSWNEQYEAFAKGKKELDFNAGYTPEDDERFRVNAYALPEWLQAGTKGKAADLAPINANEGAIESIRAIVAFAKGAKGEELVLAQTFNRSHVIQPGRFLFLQKGTYETPDHPGISLGRELAAVYSAKTETLMFENFRNTNTFLPLIEYIAEASDHDIREVLDHKLLKARDADATVAAANQWFRKRFAMLKASGILDSYSAAQLMKRSKGYEVELKVEKGRLVFPAGKPAARFADHRHFTEAAWAPSYSSSAKRLSADSSSRDLTIFQLGK